MSKLDCVSPVKVTPPYFQESVMKNKFIFSNTRPFFEHFWETFFSPRNHSKNMRNQPKIGEKSVKVVTPPIFNLKFRVS